MVERGGAAPHRAQRLDQRGVGQDADRHLGGNERGRGRAGMRTLGVGATLAHRLGASSGVRAQREHGQGLGLHIGPWSPPLGTSTAVRAWWGARRHSSMQSACAQASTPPPHLLPPHAVHQAASLVRVCPLRAGPHGAIIERGAVVRVPGGCRRGRAASCLAVADALARVQQLQHREKVPALQGLLHAAPQSQRRRTLLGAGQGRPVVPVLGWRHCRRRRRRWWRSRLLLQGRFTAGRKRAQPLSEGIPLPSSPSKENAACCCLPANQRRHRLHQILDRSIWQLSQHRVCPADSQAARVAEGVTEQKLQAMAPSFFDAFQPAVMQTNASKSAERNLMSWPLRT